MIVYKISEAVANEIKIFNYMDGVKFHPIKDINGNWVISMEELKQWTTDIGIDLQFKIEPIEFEPIEYDLEGFPT